METEHQLKDLGILLIYHICYDGRDCPMCSDTGVIYDIDFYYI